MALVLADRVQETTTSTGTGSVILAGAVNGYQTFSAGIGNGNTCYYTIYDNTSFAWEVGIGTFTTSPNTLARNTILSSSNSGSAINLAGNTAAVWVDYPSGKSVYKDANGNVSANSFTPGWTSNTTASATTTLTVISSYYQRFVGTLTQTVILPDATTVSLGQGFILDNDSTGNVTLLANGGGALGAVVPGMAAFIFCENNSTAAGSWSGYMFVPGAGPSGAVTWGTSGLNMGGGTLSGATWAGSTISMTYGGTGASLLPTAGASVYSTGTNLALSAAGTTGQVLVSGGSGSPTWSSGPSLNASVIVSSTLTGTTVASTVTATSLTLGSPLAITSGGTGSTSAAIVAGTAISVSGTFPNQTVNNTGVTSAVAGTAISVSGATGAVTINNTGVTSAVAGTAISVSGSTGAVTINNTGVTSNVAGTGVSVSGATGAVTISIGQAVATSSNVQFNSLGVNTAGSGTAGEIRATNNITAYYSDERLKTKVGNIENALDKVSQIETMIYHANETAVSLGYDASIVEVGVTAQSVQKVQPEVVVPAPIDEQYLTVRYEKLVPLLIEAIKELKAEVDALKGK